MRGTERRWWWWYTVVAVVGGVGYEGEGGMGGGGLSHVDLLAPAILLKCPCPPCTLFLLYHGFDDSDAHSSCHESVVPDQPRSSLRKFSCRRACPSNDRRFEAWDGRSSCEQFGPAAGSEVGTMLEKDQEENHDFACTVAAQTSRFDGRAGVGGGSVIR